MDTYNDITHNTITLKDLAEQRKKIISGWPAESSEVFERNRFYSALTEQDIRENADSLNWKYISKYAALELISKLAEDFSDDIVWGTISTRKLPENFKCKFEDKLLKLTNFEDWLKYL